MPARKPQNTNRISSVVRSITKTADDDIIPVSTLARDIKRQLERMPHMEVRYLYWLYQSFQQERIACGNRIRIIREKGGTPLIMEHFFTQFEELERSIANALTTWVKSEPVYTQWLSKIRGIGPIIAAGLIAYVRPEYSRTAGSIWRYAGIDVGPLDELASTKYSRTFQRICWIVGKSFIYTKPQNPETKSFYYDMYLRRKKYEAERNERGDYSAQALEQLKRFNYRRNTVAYRYYSKGKLPPAHIHARAIRWTVKLFLSHLAHVTYELAYNEPPPAPYMIAIKGHSGYIGVPFFDTKADYAKPVTAVTELPDIDSMDAILDDADEHMNQDPEAMQIYELASTSVD